MKKKLALITASIVLILSAVWVVDYLALFRDNPIDSGPVVLKPEVEQQQSKPTSAPYVAERVVTDLTVPWSIVFATDNRWLVSERSGSVRVISDGILQPDPLVRFSDVSSTSEEGLMGLALDPGYEQNRLVYACYARPSNDGLVDRVVRFEDKGDSVGPFETVVDNIPAAKFHAGCRLGFGPDDKLYITTGDATDRNIAQDPNSLGGKILRVNNDGSIPDDNPAKGSAIWSSGHRNPQGIDWQPGTNRLFSTEHGPSIFDGPAGGDEVNIIEPGANYGWPIVSHQDSDPRFVDPLLVFTPAVAPGGMVFYDSDVLPQFTGDLFFAALKGEGVIRVVLDKNNPSEVVRFEKLEGINAGRIRDVAQGPDGGIYFMSSNQDGRGDAADGDDAIWRIVAE